VPTSSGVPHECARTPISLLFL
jgi:hypothetical protein